MSEIVLPQEFNINTVGDVLAEVKKVMSKNDKIVLDAKNIETIDALGLQLILSIEKTAAMNKIKYKLVNVTPILQKHLPQ